MDYKNFIGKYIGPKKIKDIVLLKNEKTYLEKNKVKVIFDDDKTYVYPEEALKDIVTENEQDASELRELRTKAVVEKILTILVDSELTLPEINYAIGPKLTASIQDAQKRANKILLGKEEYEVNLMDIEKILRSANKTMKKKHGNKAKTQ